MYEEPSCVDCQGEAAESKWKEILLNWINACIAPGCNIEELHADFLSKTVELYKDDISFTTKIMMVFPENVEDLLKNEYQIDLSETTCDDTKKMYLIFSLLLYHCCITTKGEFTNDICDKMSKNDQVAILSFCEELDNGPVTVENINKAIKDALEIVQKSSITSCTLSPSEDSMVTKNRTLKCKPSLYAIQSRTGTRPSTSYCSISTKKDTDISSPKKDLYSASKYENEVAVMCLKKNVKRDDGNNLREDGNKSDIFTPSIQGQYPRSGCKKGCTCAKCRLNKLKKLREKEEAKEAKKKKKKTPKCCRRCLSCLKEFFPASGADWVIFIMKTLLLIYIFGVVWIDVLSNVLTDMNGVHAGKTGSLLREGDEDEKAIDDPQNILRTQPEVLIWGWVCKDNVCQKIFEPKTKSIHLTYNRCSLLCTGPQLWPQPTGPRMFNRSLIALTTNGLSYYFEKTPSETVQQYMERELKLFETDLKLLEKLKKPSKVLLADLPVSKSRMKIVVMRDPNPKLRLDTDESYQIIIATNDSETLITLNACSYCGARHGLETLRQLIVYDGVTGNLMTLADAVVNDAPKFKYRGLMIDTARNYIPLQNLKTTIDAMAACKLNTFHWRISDATSFPLVLPELSELSDYGAYSSSMVYTVEDVKSLAERAAFKGIRIVLEVSFPGPVGRPWSWSKETTCARGESSCDSILCNQAKMHKSFFDALQLIYAATLDMTNVDDVFHISDSVFSFGCKVLLDDRLGFLRNAMERLVLANRGIEPKLVLAWYHRYILNESSWETRALQLHVWQEGLKKSSLKNNQLIHSSKWELSCLIKDQRCIFYRTWQTLYTWRPWDSIEALSHIGGEALLWTDLVDAGNLDYHLWPRAAAVAERLWSDESTNGTVDGEVYIRLDAQRKRMQLRKFIVQPVWPQECSTNPVPCLATLREDSKIVKKKKRVNHLDRTLLIV